jgi:hypothetical protein
MAHNPNKDGGAVLEAVAVCGRLRRRNLETLPTLKVNMKMILLFACVITLLTTAGCFFPGRGGHWGGRADATIAPPIVAAAASEVIVVRPVGTVGALEGMLP